MTAHNIKHLAFIGLGKMGYNMVLHLLDQDYEVVAYNKSPEPTQKLEKNGATGAFSIEDLSNKLKAPRVFWIMVPHAAVGEVLDELTKHLKPGDIVIDGGNSFYKDSIKRSHEYKTKGIAFLDAGVSGGPERAREGSSIMVGGNKETVDAVKNIFEDLCIKDACAYLGPSGAGHFTKMVHNGIEYGMMQAIAEGFDILKSSEFELDLREVMKAYKHGSVIASDLLIWLDRAFEKHGQDLEEISGTANRSGEGDWTHEAAEELGVEDNVIEDSLEAREKSEGMPSYQGKLLSAMRGEFGGHDVRKH